MVNKNTKDREHFASVISNNSRISTKSSVEVMNFIRNKKLKRAKIIMEDVIAHKIAVPFRRYHKDLAHKRKIGPGSYPEKVCMEVLSLLNSLEANAENKGLNVENLVLTTCIANRGNRVMRHGRQIRRMFKHTHLELRAEEK